LKKDDTPAAGANARCRRKITHWKIVLQLLRSTWLGMLRGGLAVSEEEGDTDGGTEDKYNRLVFRIAYWRRRWQEGGREAEGGGGRRREEEGAGCCKGRREGGGNQRVEREEEEEVDSQEADQHCRAQFLGKTHIYVNSNMGTTHVYVNSHACY